MKHRKTIVIILSLILFGESIMASAKGVGLTEEQKKVADEVANVAMKKWDKYGVLPSVAVAQTFVESSLGTNPVRPSNLWGLRPEGEYASYPSLRIGIYSYLDVLNNGLYDKALYKKNYRNQLREILRGGVLRRG